MWWIGEIDSTYHKSGFESSSIQWIIFYSFVIMMIGCETVRGTCSKNCIKETLLIVPGGQFIGRVLPSPRVPGIETSLLNHFCSRQKMNYFHMTSRQWRSAKDHFSAFDLLLSQFWMVRRDQILMPPYSGLWQTSICHRVIEFSTKIEAYRLRIEIRCITDIAPAIGLYWKRLSKYCSNEIKLLFPRYFSPQQCGAKKLFCSGKKIHLIKSSLEILNLAWHEACRCKWLSAARNEKSRSEMAPGEDIGQKMGKLKLGILSI